MRLTTMQNKREEYLEDSVYVPEGQPRLNFTLSPVPRPGRLTEYTGRQFET